MTTTLQTTLLLTLTLTGTAASAQMTGVSHPEQQPITASSEAIPAQAVTVAKPSAQVPLQARTYQPVAVATVPNPDGSIVEAVQPEHLNTVAMDRVDASLAGGRVALTPDPDAGIVTRVEGPANELPEGTLVKAELKQDLSTKDTRVGSVFSAELTEPVMRDGRVFLPTGSMLSGKITEARGGKRISGGAALHLEPLSVSLPDGTVYHLRAQVIDTSIYKTVRVDSEGTITPRTHPKETAAVVGLSTGAGAAAGAVFGGVPGALVGAGVGAGVSTTMLLKQERQADLPMGTHLVFSLTHSLAVTQ